MNRLLYRHKRKSGFTLIEIMLVVAILSVMAMIAIPKFADMIDRSKEAAIKGHLGALRGMVSLYYVDNEGRYPWGPWTFIPKYIEKYPAVPAPPRSAHASIAGDPIQVVRVNPIPSTAIIIPADFGRLAYYLNVFGVAPPPDQLPRAYASFIMACWHRDLKGVPWTAN